MKTSTTNSASRNFFKAAILAILAVCFTVSLKAQYAQQWVSTLNANAQSYYSTKVVKDAGNNLYTYANNKLAKYSPAGTMLWQVTNPDMIYDMFLNDNGDIFITGIYSLYYPQKYFYVTKFNSSGNELWSKITGGAANTGYYPWRIITDNQGSIYVSATIQDFNNNFSGSFLYKFDISGNPIWNTDVGLEQTMNIKIYANNSILVIGYTYQSGYSTFIKKFSLSGIPINSVPVDSGFVHDLTVDNAGNLFATGDHTLKINPAGVKVWEKSNGFRASGITLDANNNIYLCGSIGGYSNSDAVMAKMDANGNMMWAQYYSGLANGPDGFAQIALMPNGSIVVCGSTTRTYRNSDMLLVKYTSAGVQQFTSTYNGSADSTDYGQNMVLIGNDVVIGGISKTVPGIYGYSGCVVKFSDVTGINSTNNEIPEGFNLSQNYPNPFNPSTKISFSIPKSSLVKIVVYDITGKEVETLVNENLNAGSFEVDFNASKLTSGVYFYRITADGFNETKKMILTK